MEKPWAPLSKQQRTFAESEALKLAVLGPQPLVTRWQSKRGARGGGGEGGCGGEDGGGGKDGGSCGVGGSVGEGGGVGGVHGSDVHNKSAALL